MVLFTRIARSSEIDKIPGLKNKDQSARAHSYAHGREGRGRFNSEISPPCWCQSDEPGPGWQEAHRSRSLSSSRNRVAAVVAVLDAAAAVVIVGL